MCHDIIIHPMVAISERHEKCERSCPKAAKIQFLEAFAGEDSRTDSEVIYFAAHVERGETGAQV